MYWHFCHISKFVLTAHGQLRLQVL